MIQATHATFDCLSQTLAFSSVQVNLLANLTALNQAISDRLSQIGTTDNLPTTLAPGEIKRVSASIYGLKAIASELKDLTQALDSTVASS